MKFTPALRHILVSPFSQGEVLARIRSKTRQLGDVDLPGAPLFNGHFEKNRFSLFEHIKTPQNALPLVKGEVDNTSRGSIIFLEMGLFPAAKIYLVLFSLMALVVALVFFFISALPTAGVLALLTGLANYAILTANFHKKAQSVTALLQNLLD